MDPREGAPSRSLRALDVMAMIVGLVIGAGIFKAPSIVAANSSSEAALMLAWLAGGIVSIGGALCYAELAAAFPHAGGEYHFLHRAYGRQVGFLFAWSRLLVLQTGSIALLGFVLGDYAAQLLPLGPHGPAIFAALSVAALTALNLAGLRSSAAVQMLLTLITLAGMLLIVVAGLAADPPAPRAAAAAGREETFGLAMVFVLLTYGGWNEAAYVSAELRNVRRDMARVLVASLALVTALYLLVNFAYLKVLGLEPMARSEAVTAELMHSALGRDGALVVSGLIVVALLASINVTVLTGARTNYALAADYPLFRFLGRWSPRVNAPVTALLLQGAIALLLIFFGAASRSGFEAMVSYVAPVFWLFFFLTTLSLIVLRRRHPHQARPFRVPGYPWIPLAFAAVCLFMFYSSVVYSGWGALAGLALLGLGIPLSLFRANQPPP